MAETSDHAAGDGDTAATDAGATRMNLPAVVAPQLSAADHGETSAADESAQTKTTAVPARSKRFVALARFIYPSPQAPAAPTSGIENTIAAMREIKLELAAVAALKASLDSAARATTNQYAKIADRLDRIDQRSVAVVETTASLPAATQASAPAQTAALGAVTSESQKLSDRILPDWVVHDVQNGHALVESRYGGLFAVSAGSVLPGIGRVDMIKRQDGHWVVLTARGTITSAR